MDKPHLTFLNGFWAVQWPELTPQNYDDVLKTWGWVIKKNSLLSADSDFMRGCDCVAECFSGCPRWAELMTLTV